MSIATKRFNALQAFDNKKVLLEEVTEGWLKNCVSEMRVGLCNPALASAEVLNSKLVSH